jgi:hypothetical protein
VIDTNTNISNLISMTVQDNEEYVGICLGKFRKIFTAPYAALKILVIDSNSNATALLNFPHQVQARRINMVVLQKQTIKIFAAPFSATSILVIDANTNATSTIPSPSPLNDTSEKWFGIARGPNGKCDLTRDNHPNSSSLRHR